MRVRRLFIALVAGALVMLVVITPGIAQQGGIQFGPPAIHPKTTPHRSGPVSDDPQPVGSVVGERRVGTPSPGPADIGETDPVGQLSEAEQTQRSAPIVDGRGGAVPNDTVGDVAPNH